MEKVNLKGKKQIEFSCEKELNDSLKNDEFKKIISRLNVSKEEVLKNTTKINDTLCELKKCSECKGLFECKNGVSGHVFFPQNIDDKIRFSYAPCKYEKKFIKEKEEKETSSNILDNARMKDIDVTDKNRVKVIKWLKNFYDKFEVNKINKGLFLHGNFGSGKTFLLASLFNELKINKNINAEIVYYPDLLRSLRDDFNLLDAKVNYLKDVPLLLIDDIGAENVTAWGRDEILGTIMQHRMNEGLSTFLTSNLNIVELESHLSITKNSEDGVKARRIIERIKQLTDDLELISINRRK